MDEGFSVQLSHNPKEDEATVGDVAILGAGGTSLLAEYAGYQLNRNLNLRVEV
jgi:hypothetical protein